MYTTESSTRCSVMTQGGGMRSGGREAQQGEDVCMHTADSLHYTAEMNTTL